jgi:hypothetical protein
VAAQQFNQRASEIRRSSIKGNVFLGAVPEGRQPMQITAAPAPDDPIEELLDRVGVARVRLLDIEDNERLTPDGRISLKAAFVELTRAYDLGRIASLVP